MKPKKCFVIMPFSKTSKDQDATYWNNFYNTFLTPALEAHGYDAYRSVATPNNITKHIIRELAMADLVLAVLTGDKPNVFYELGVRHSLRQGTIMILEGERRPPFDITNYGILFYEDNDLNKFRSELGQSIKAAEENNEDSPVADFLNQRITVSVNLVIARLRQCVEILKDSTFANRDAALEEIRSLQKDWDSTKMQVAVVIDDQIKLHPGPCEEGQMADEQWKDVTLDAKSLYPMMKERHFGFRITQIDKWPNRLTAIAWEEVERGCLVIAEAHYFQESRPY